MLDYNWYTIHTPVEGLLPTTGIAHTVPKFGLQYIQIEGLWSSEDEESKWCEFVLEGLYKNGGVFK